jgi:hypothetical protein
MGANSQKTVQGMGSFFDMLYQNPSLMFIFVIGTTAAGIYFWRKSKAD